MKRPVRLGKTATRVLFLVLNGHDRGLPYRFTELAAACEVCESRVIEILNRLEGLGLINRERFRGRTIVPLCRFIPAEELPNGSKE